MILKVLKVIAVSFIALFALNANAALINGPTLSFTAYGVEIPLNQLMVTDRGLV